MKTNEAIHFLIVEDEEEVSDVVCLFLAGCFEASFTVASCGNKAIELLKSNSHQFKMIVSDFNMPNGNGSDLFKYVKEHHPNLPFMLVTSDSWNDHREFHGFAHVGYVAKPFTDDTLADEAKRLMMACNLEVYQEHQFVGISLPVLLNIKSITHPVYVKLNNEKYVKFINPGIEISKEDIEKYKQKGILSLYVEKRHFPEFINQFKNRVVENMLFRGIKSIPQEALELSATVQDMLLGAVRNLGTSKETEELAQKNVCFVRDMIQSHSELNSIVNWAYYTQQEYTCAHSVLISYLTTDVSNHLTFQTPNASEILALSAFFHDISLENHQIKNEIRFIKALSLNSKINKSDLDLVKRHPEISINKLKGWKFCPEEVIRIVREHHEKPNGSGFPDGKTADQIGELTACFIVCEDLAQCLLELKDRNAVELYFQSLAALYSSPKFKPTYDYLCSKLKVTQVHAVNAG